MRAFIALELPETFIHETAGLSRALAFSTKGRFVSRDNYHITLAFLGDVDKADADRAAEAIDAACDGAAAVPLRCSGIGKFGRGSNATLWLGVIESPEVMELAARVRSELAVRGIDFDGKRFLPHITLARHAQLPKAEIPGLPFPADDTAYRVTLFKSTLDSQGATYKPLYSAELEE